jgi:multiple sugar transport system ATP-binding protein
MAKVTITDLRKSYGKTKIITGISFDVIDGEFVALVGPSGCGKSTLLRMIAGLETVTSGTIAIGDSVVNDVQPKDRDIAMVFQNYALYPNKTVAANIAFPLRMAGMSRADADAKVAEVAQILGLEPLLGRYPKQLSGGQRQRVAMGRAIVRKPKAFLFDEPLSNLDAKLRVKMRAEIKELHQRLKSTTIYVTHDQVEAMTMADRIVVMREGRIEQMGRPLDLYDQPANKFVASFIGSPAMNFLEGTVVVHNSVMYFRSRNGMLIKLEAAHARLMDQAVTLGIRPEHIELATVEEGGSIPMTISVIEPTGGEATFILRAGKDELVVVKNGRHGLSPGETVWIRPMAEHLHFFDEQENIV